MTSLTNYKKWLKRVSESAEKCLQPLLICGLNYAVPIEQLTFRRSYQLKSSGTSPRYINKIYKANFDQHKFVYAFLNYYFTSVFFQKNIFMQLLLLSSGNQIVLVEVHKCRECYNNLMV